MRTPTLHMNGTSKEALLETAENAINSLFDAMSSVALTGPNARDYYPQGSGAFISAQNEHADRMSRLAGVLNELTAIATAIDAA
jgi:hypothetical protein